jgi:integrase
VTLGRINELSVTDARKAANEILVAARQGRDVIGEQRAKHRAGLTLVDAYNEYSTALKRRGVSENTLIHNAATWKRVSRYGNRELALITKRDVRAWHTEWGKSGPSAANHAGRLLRTVYNYAARFADHLPANPCTAIEWFPERELRRVIAAEDVSAWWSKVEAIENPVRRAYWKVILFTGLRKSDAASMRWSEVDERGIHRPNPKGGRTRAFTLPMTSELKAILTEARIAATLVDPKSDWVFPAASRTGHLMEATEKTFPDVKPHALRRTYATACIEAGIDPYTVKMLLNHTPDKGDVTARYVQPSADHAARAAQIVASHIGRLVREPLP